MLPTKGREGTCSLRAGLSRVPPYEASNENEIDEAQHETTGNFDQRCTPGDRPVLPSGPGGGFLFLSGQIPLDPATGELVTGDVGAQTKQVMENLGSVLRGGGVSFGEVVRATIYLTNLGDFAKVNEVYGGYFSTNPPARATVQVAALPRGASVEST